MSLRERLALLLQPRDLLGDVERGIVLHEAQLFDLRLQLGDGLLEIEKSGFHAGLMIPDATTHLNTSATPSPARIARRLRCAVALRLEHGLHVAPRPARRLRRDAPCAAIAARHSGGKPCGSTSTGRASI